MKSKRSWSNKISQTVNTLKISVLLIGTVVLWTACVHDFGYDSPPYLQDVCVRWKASDGQFYQRQATYGSHNVGKVLAESQYSYLGTCKPAMGGRRYRVMVCLVASSPCAHDRTTGVWPDQVEHYLEKYPGSYRGECTSECSKHQDDCLDKQPDP